MHFGISDESTSDCVSLYNNAGLISKVSEEIASEQLKVAVVDLTTNTSQQLQHRMCRNLESLAVFAIFRFVVIRDTKKSIWTKNERNREI